MRVRVRVWIFVFFEKAAIARRAEKVGVGRGSDGDRPIALVAEIELWAAVHDGSSGGGHVFGRSLGEERNRNFRREKHFVLSSLSI